MQSSPKLRLLKKFYAGGPDKETLRLLGISNFS
jgi:hypothetical protein